MEWQNLSRIYTCSWRCGFCGKDVASDRGWHATGQLRSGRGQQIVKVIAICPRCSLPSVVDPGTSYAVPEPIYGHDIEHLPEDVAALYAEARRAVGSGAPNSAALACRKILMHVGVEKGAPEDGSFLSYVDYLCNNGYVPPDAREWVDEIREHGNDANHEIDLISREETETIVDFTAMLLQMVYEFPQRGRLAREARQERRP